MKSLRYKLIAQNKFLALQDKVATLEKQIEAAKNFVKAIEKGDLSASLAQHDSMDKESLGSSLLNMRDQMKRISDEEKQRTWVTEGLAKFVDILRTKNDDLAGLGDLIISNIVKYVNANQGSLYILDDDDPADIHLEMIACYAYNRKKHMTHRINLGDGLAGQAVLEKDTLYLTNLPGNYLKISSGLGEALPKNLLIVPLLLNEKVYGVIEMASFNLFEPHHREFIERLAESIASTISSVRINQQTRKLLNESQVQAEQMRAQEEEMRQNMEELAATQEEMQRVMRETEGKEAYIKQLMNVSADSIFTIDRNYKLVTWNKAFAQSLERFGMRVEKGTNTLDWYQGDERRKQIDLYDRVLHGETFEMTAASELNGATYHFLSIYAPLRDDNGEIFEAAVFAKDVTAMTQAQKKAEQLHEEALQQTEELKAQEEEMRQNLEELSATQEEMQRILNEVQSREGYLDSLLNASRDSIFTIDREFKLISFNQGFSAGLTQMGLTIDKGFPILDLFPDEKQKAEQRGHYERAFKGESFDVTSEFNFNDTLSYYTSSFSPLRNAHGEIFALAIFGKDVTQLMLAKNQAEDLAYQAQQKTEEMKAQEEELRQNMEEMAAQQEEMQRIVSKVETSHNYANQLLDASKDMIFTIDREFKLVSWNQTFAASLEQFGTKIEKGMNTLDWYGDEQRQQQLRVYNRVLGGEAFETSMVSEINGSSYHFLNIYAPLKDEKGEVFEAAIFARDITASATAHEKMESRDKFMKEVINGCNNPIYIVDKEFRFVDFNEAFRNIIRGIGTELQTGMDSLSIIQNKKEREAVKRQIERVFKGEAFDQIQEFTSGGQARHIWLQYKPIRDSKGEVIASGVYSEDLTELMTVKKLNSELLKQVKNQN